MESHIFPSTSIVGAICQQAQSAQRQDLPQGSPFLAALTLPSLLLSLGAPFTPAKHGKLCVPCQLLLPGKFLALVSSISSQQEALLRHCWKGSSAFLHIF